MHRCLNSLKLLSNLSTIGGVAADDTLRTPPIPSGFAGELQLAIDIPTHSFGYVISDTQGSYVPDSDYILLTTPGAVTHAFWFDTTGTDAEPAGSVAADNSYQVNISADTTAVDVAIRLAAAINTAAIGITAGILAGLQTTYMMVDAAGAAGNGWTLQDFATGIVNLSDFNTAVNAGGVIVGDSGQEHWLGSFPEDVANPVVGTVTNIGEIDFDFRDAVAVVGATMDTSELSNVATVDTPIPDVDIPTSGTAQFTVTFTPTNPSEVATFQVSVWQGDGEGGANTVLNPVFYMMVTA